VSHEIETCREMLGGGGLEEIESSVCVCVFDDDDDDDVCVCVCVCDVQQWLWVLDLVVCCKKRNKKTRAHLLAIIH
jgi:hypothetical protein